jgi:hypothetical protein
VPTRLTGTGSSKKESVISGTCGRKPFRDIECQPRNRELKPCPKMPRQGRETSSERCDSGAAATHGAPGFSGHSHSAWVVRSSLNSYFADRRSDVSGPGESTCPAP